MNPIANPFAPGAGSQPPELAGRKEILEGSSIALARIRDRKAAKSMVLVGLRGVGKTVLLNRIWEAAEGDGYRAVLIEAHEDKRIGDLLVPPLRQILFRLDAMQSASEKVKRGFRVLRSFIKGVSFKVGEVEVSYDPEIGTADSGDLEADLADLLVAIGEAAADRKTAVAICVDEMQYLNEKELSALIMAIHRINQRGLPLTLVGAGLPQIVGLTGKSKSYGERLFDFPEVGPLKATDAESALQRSPITPDQITTASKLAIENLDRSFFRVRFDRLTPREKEYMRALATLGEGKQRSGDIADKLGVTSQSVAPIRSGLIKKGMIYSPAYGDTAFTVPLFGDFLIRTMPAVKN